MLKVILADNQAIFRAGAAKARALARRTMAQVRRRMGFLGGAEA